MFSVEDKSTVRSNGMHRMSGEPMLELFHIRCFVNSAQELMGVEGQDPERFLCAP